MSIVLQLPQHPSDAFEKGVIEALTKGESVILARGGTPVGRIVPNLPIDPPVKLRRGMLKGFYMADDFDAPIGA